MSKCFDFYFVYCNKVSVLTDTEKIYINLDLYQIFKCNLMFLKIMRKPDKLLLYCVYDVRE